MDIHTNGEVSEWPIEHAWKACILQGIEGSNPSLSAKENATCPRRASFHVGDVASLLAHVDKMKT